MNKQKFIAGTRVRVADNLGIGKEHFQSGVNATIISSHAEEYGGYDFDNYTISIDGWGEVAWYQEHQLTVIEDS